MSRLLPALALCLLLPCALAETQPPAPEADPSLLFIDSKLFDGRLYHELSKQPAKLEITMPGRVELTDLSPRLDRWLSVVGENGQMTLQETPDPSTVQQKGLFSVIPMIFSLVSAVREALMYAEAKRYNGTLYYHRDNDGNAVVDRIVLQKK